MPNHNSLQAVLETATTDLTASVLRGYTFVEISESESRDFMRLTSRTEYGVRAMYELARNYGVGPVPLNSIAASQSIPENYLEQLFILLKRGGLIISSRGALGGYSLSKDPREIRVGDIVRALEGSLAPCGCVEDDSGHCDRADECAVHPVWKRLKDGIVSILDGTTLGDMLSDTSAGS